MKIAARYPRNLCDARNQMNVDEVVDAVHAGWSPVLLTEWREHLTYLAEKLSGKVRNIVVLAGGMGRKQRGVLLDLLKNIPEDDGRLIIATGRYLGEGFEDARLDTLFLALPIACVERLHNMRAVFIALKSGKVK